MKKFIKIALLTIIFVMSTILNVYAADGTAEVITTPSATTAKIGDTVTVTIVAKYADGIEGFDGVLSWDATKLEFTNALEVNESTGGLSDFFEGETGKFLLTKMASSSTKDELSVATLKFKVLDKATVDEKLTVTISDIEVGGYGDSIENKIIEITVVDGTSEGEQTPGDDQETPILSGIKVASDAIKVSYKAGEKFDKSGLRIIAEYTDGTSKEITNYTYSPDGELSVEDKVLLITYTEGEITKTTTQAITVEAVKSEEEPKEPAKEDDKKDPTTADKPINNAGLETYGFIALLTIIVAIVLYAKCRKYSDVK